MTQALIERDIAGANLLALFRENASDAPALRDVRKRAAAAFAEHGLPLTSEENWKYTNVLPIGRLDIERGREFRIDRSSIDKVSMRDSIELVFVNGRFAAELSNASDSRVMPFSRGGVADPAALHVSNTPFVALNTSLFEDGVTIAIPSRERIERPVHLIFVGHSEGAASVATPRIIVSAGSNSSATIVETYLSDSAAATVIIPVVELQIGENATIDHYKIVRESTAAYHVANTFVRQERSATYNSYALIAGGALVRNEIEIDLVGDGANCSLDGLYLTSGTQHADTHSVVNHRSPNTTSLELYKGVLDGKSTGVFDGKMVVEKNAQKIVARQTNNNLLLSNEATADSKPQLEIYADDVKCNHGSTIGQLDEEALFYLRSRGIGAVEARSILTYAFASEIVERMRLAPVREQLQALLLSALPGSPEVTP